MPETSGLVCGIVMMGMPLVFCERLPKGFGPGVEIPIADPSPWSLAPGPGCFLLRRHIRGRMPGRAHVSRGVLDRLDDVHVSRASAQVPRDRLTNLELRWRGISFEQCDGRHHHARCAEATLERVLFLERLLHGVQLAAELESFDSGDAPSVSLDGEQCARLHWLSVEKHGARAAVRRV